MGLKFGTDGVRGLALDELKPDWVTRLGAATARITGVKTFVIGIDGRETGPIFAKALASGFKEAGASYEYVGVAPTPAIAHISSISEVGGAVISASHNQAEYNGIKFFLPGGKKLPDDQQFEIEAALHEEFLTAEFIDELMLSPSRDDLLQSWVTSIRNSIVSPTLEDLLVVVDSANGAASAFAPQLFKEFGANVISIHDKPNGKNINLKSGSTNMGDLTRTVKEMGADLGIAFDGDADRALAVDGDGSVIDGDFLIAIFASDMHKRRVLRDETTVVSVMTNLGFHLAMKEQKIKTHVTPVGDRHILQALQTNNWSLGGEQSGHIIFPDLSTTGDGILTALQLLDVLKRSGTTIRELSRSSMQKSPQSLRAVELPMVGTEIIAEMKPLIEEIERSLGETGRVLVRPSGTEPILRIMVEAPMQKQVDDYAQQLVETAERILFPNK
ncbi:MAG: phosphoglucosamine mutase [Actinomycetota bacterium]